MVARMSVASQFYAKQPAIKRLRMALCKMWPIWRRWMIGIGEFPFVTAARRWAWSSESVNCSQASHCAFGTCISRLAKDKRLVSYVKYRHRIAPVYRRCIGVAEVATSGSKNPAWIVSSTSKAEFTGLGFGFETS